MVSVCASVLGVEKEKVISVSTDFGPEGPAEDAARRRLEATSRWDRESRFGSLFFRPAPLLLC